MPVLPPKTISIRPTIQEKQQSYQIFNQIAKSYDFLNHLLSLGIDIYWRNQLLSFLPPNDSLRVLDLATGTGDVAICLGKNPKVQEVLGIDLSEGMIKIGQNKVTKKGLFSKVQLQIGDGVEIPFPNESFHAVTTSFGIRNFSDPLQSLQNMRRVLKPGGRALIMEFSLPTSAIFRKIYLFYFRHILPQIGKILSGHPRAYSYLNQTVETFPYGKDFLELMKKAQFTNLKAYPLTFGIATLYIGERSA